jgi:hypothetical protein
MSLSVQRRAKLVYELSSTLTAKTLLISPRTRVPGSLRARPLVDGVGQCTTPSWGHFGGLGKDSLSCRYNVCWFSYNKRPVVRSRIGE